MRVGNVDMASGDVYAALHRYLTSAEALEQAVASDPVNPMTRRFFAPALGKVGEAFEASGQTRAALEQYQKDTGMQRRLMEADPQDAMSRNSYALTLQVEANLRSKTATGQALWPISGGPHDRTETLDAESAKPAA